MYYDIIFGRYCEPFEDFRLNSKTCIKRSPVGWRKSGLLRQVTSYKRFNAYANFLWQDKKNVTF